MAVCIQLPQIVKSMRRIRITKWRFYEMYRTPRIFKNFRY